MGRPKKNKEQPKTEVCQSGKAKKNKSPNVPRNAFRYRMPGGLKSSLRTLQGSVDIVCINQNAQRMDIKDIRENQEKLFVALEKVEETKKVQIQIPPQNNCPGFDFWKKKSTVPTSGKEFILKHVFKNVSNMEENIHYSSELEEHFGVQWKIKAARGKEDITLYLHCHDVKIKEKQCSIEAGVDLKIVSTTGKYYSESNKFVFATADKSYGWGYEIVPWNEMMKNCVIDDSITAEIHVKIKKMSGICQKKHRKFDESNQTWSDVTLIVGEEKFYISKLYLANHSPYFNRLFIGEFQKCQKADVCLTGADCEDFQKYLEVLYGDPAIDEQSVEGILLVADSYDTPIVVKKCEDFLVEKSGKLTKKKLEMATRYNLDKLKENCLSKINTVNQIKEVLPCNIRDMDPSVVADLLKKALAEH